MKTEIVIATRGELQENLAHTIASIRETAGDVPVHVVFDGEETKPYEIEGVKTSCPWVAPRGCGYARHWAITQTDATLVVICDGHMTFPAGWLKEIQNKHRRNKRLMTCCRMRSVGAGWTALDDRIYAGAFVAYLKQERGFDGIDYHALKGTWLDACEPGPVPCVMGACYGIRRAWYDEIGQPLELCDEWGQDEELLSLATHFCGGRVECLEPIVDHYYAAPWIGRPVAHPDATMRRIASRMAVVQAMPAEADERAVMLEFISRKPRDYMRINELVAVRRAIIDRLRELWGKTHGKWEEIKAKQIVRPCNEAENRQAMGFRDTENGQENGEKEAKPTRLIVPQYRETAGFDPAGRCDRCNHPFSRSNTNPANGYQGMRKCAWCGHKQRVRP